MLEEKINARITLNHTEILSKYAKLAASSIWLWVHKTYPDPLFYIWDLKEESESGIDK